MFSVYQNIAGVGVDVCVRAYMHAYMFVSVPVESLSHSFKAL